MPLKLSLSVLGPAAVGLAVALLLVSRTIYRRKFITPNLPPGPRGLPIIGVQFYLSTVNSSATDIYLHYFPRMYLTCRTANSGSRTLNGAVNTVSIQIYINKISLKPFPFIFEGDICSITLLGQPLVIINSSRVMEDLDRRGTIYSDRPKLEMGGELVGYSKTVVLMPYGAALRNYRKHIARLIGSANAVGKYFEVEEEETRKFLRRLSTSPSDLSVQLRKYVVLYSIQAPI